MQVRPSSDGGGGAPVFYYDLTDPLSYLAAERINASMAVVGEWEPVLGSALGIAPAAVDRAALERQAEGLGLLPLRWPLSAGGPAVRRQPGRTAALAATYAKQLGRTVAFSLAAFRQAFAGGNDLDQELTVLLAGAACELHPRALRQAIARPAVADALRQACDRAQRAGVARLPAIEVMGTLCSGHDAVEQAAARIQRQTT